MPADLSTNLINTVIFTLLGLIIFIGGFWLMDKFSPYDLWKEIVEEQNRALAILVGSMSVGVAIIIAAVMIG
jgi:uncharacterized membrane protein YjfL (UPF0719 family)